MLWLEGNGWSWADKGLCIHLDQLKCTPEMPEKEGLPYWREIYFQLVTLVFVQGDFLLSLLGD